MRKYMAIKHIEKFLDEDFRVAEKDNVHSIKFTFTPDDEAHIKVAWIKQEVRE